VLTSRTRSAHGSQICTHEASGLHERLAESSKRDTCPYQLDDSEWPCAGEEPIEARQCAPKHEPKNEPSTATLKRVHDHHERHRTDAVERDCHPFSQAPVQFGDPTLIERRANRQSPRSAACVATPRHASLTAIAAMASAASGSAHQPPECLFWGLAKAPWAGKVPQRCEQIGSSGANERRAFLSRNRRIGRSGGVRRRPALSRRGLPDCKNDAREARVALGRRR
jgi:hypothetical protein